MIVVPLLDHAEDVVLANDQVLSAFDVDLSTRVLGEEDFVALLHVEGLELAVVADLALAYGDDLALLGLFLGRVRDDDPAGCRFFFVESLHDEAILQGANLMM